jgi:UDP-N-acetylmuramate dehydrogenase
MTIEHQLPLAKYTSFQCGGSAEEAIIVDSSAELEEVLRERTPDWFLGFGSNSLISDSGLPGLTLIMRGGHIADEDGLLVADAGVWWNDLVLYAIEHQLWGMECMSAIPGGVGAAVVGNIAAYGQAVADTLQWIDVYDTSTNTAKRISAGDLGLQYRKSTVLQDNRNLLVVRAAFKLSASPAKEIEYESALSVARDNGYDLSTLAGRRQAIIGAREKAGSLWDYRHPGDNKTAGSFFRNPLVDHETAVKIMSYDETGKSLELLEKMNKVHGGDASRVSAAHVLLAAGFERGQTWGEVRLHPQHVLKIENAGHASAQDVYNVSQEIIHTVKDKLGVDLDPEVRFLGDF